MNKSQITKAARECGYDSHYDGKNKQFNLSILNGQKAKHKKLLEASIKGAGYSCKFS